MKSENIKALALAIVLGCSNVPVRACGPFFPNNLLGAGDHAVLQPPVAMFRRELERLNLAPPPEHYAADCGVFRTDEAGDAELRDLTNALARLKVDGEETARICTEHAAARQKLKTFSDARASWLDDWQQNGRGLRVLPPEAAEPPFPAINAASGLPGEFADYFTGACAWHAGQPDAARAAWEQLLARPAAERRYKSVWAAYMLGKSWEANQAEGREGDNAKALEYFARAQEMARRGSVDSLGLAAQSAGWAARIHLHQKAFAEAIELYLKQAASGDDSAVISLRRTASAALDAEGATPEQLIALAGNPRTRGVLSAFLISRGSTDFNAEVTEGDDDAAPPIFNPVTAWLGAVEAAGVKDVDCAEQLALAAYQANDMKLAQRWVNRAAGRPVARWVQAKLWLRAGKITPAITVLAELSRIFPQNQPGTNAPTQLADSLFVDNGTDYAPLPAGRQALGELGTLQLARRDYVASLDALLRGGHWEDAAYVGERVLTCDELKNYVNQNWPVLTEGESESESVSEAVYNFAPLRPRERIRNLLARRLTREIRGNEAREYYPTNDLADFDAFCVALRDGWNTQLPGSQRATALFTAAQLARSSGLELFGTELQPDWGIHGGSYDWGVTWQDRVTNASSAKINFASSNEVARASAHGADPETRFHYRYKAAFLAWEAAQLMPDNADETARVLCTAGSWIKYLDPATADIFYKALVRRCGRTAIGAQADKMRWFPVLDEDGQPRPWQPHRVETIEPSTPIEVPEETPPAELEENALTVPAEQYPALPTQ